MSIIEDDVESKLPNITIRCTVHCMVSLKFLSHLFQIIDITL